MPRYRVTIEYDGTPFNGWQRQLEPPSVQEALEDAIFAFSGEEVRTQAAGRTDSGVHAKGQVAHFDLTKTWDPFRIGEALNYHLKRNPVAILDCAEVDETFEARFSAKSRHYEYRILNRRARAALEHRRVWHVPSELNVDLMHEAAQFLVGEHDFTTFRSVECQAKSPHKSLDYLDVTREGGHVVVVAGARSFLHHQVRSMVGSLKLVGTGKWQPVEVQDALNAKDRARCGAQAPAAGLYLMRVEY